MLADTILLHGRGFFYSKLKDNTDSGPVGLFAFVTRRCVNAHINSVKIKQTEKPTLLTDLCLGAVIVKLVR